MFTRFVKGRIYKLKMAFVLVTLIFVTGAHGKPIIKNEVEDLNILVSQVVGGQANVLVILDISQSMGVNYGGKGLGNWDSSSTITDCESAFCTGVGNCSTGTQRIFASHCAENTANTSECGSVNCIGGVCDTQSEFDNQVACVQAKASALNMGPIFTTICGGSSASNCTTPITRADAAAAIEAAANLSQCMGASKCERTYNNNQNTCNNGTCLITGGNCNNNSGCPTTDPNPACDTKDTTVGSGNNKTTILGDYTLFKTCMQNAAPPAITPNNASACTGGTSNCKGTPQFGSSRLETSLDVFFDLLDADDSFAKKTCSDPSKLFDGVNTNITCKQFTETPFRDVSSMVQASGNGSMLQELTTADANLLNIRFRATTFAGRGRWKSCTDNSSTFQAAQGGFAGQSDLKFQNVWKFFRGSQPGGGTPLALALGFDDSNDNGSKNGNVINDDALGIYKIELQTDKAISCRPEFVIVITDGDDSCSGDCNTTQASCGGTPEPLNSSTGLVPTTNANRRSSIQALSNLRTFYVRKPEQGVKKEILTFVIGLGVKDPHAIRTLNAMALGGGTHTTGVIKHTDPNGSIIGNVDLDTLLPGSGNQVIRNFGEALGISTGNGSSAQLQDCKTPSEAPDTHCHFQSQDIFADTFFSTAGPVDSTTNGDSFAFFVNSPEDLITALRTIFGFVNTFSTSGVSPTAPQSSTSVALRDRIFLSILTPITTDRLWQGRLALYGFVDKPGSSGAKVVADNEVNLDVQDRVIFNDNGSLKSEKASKFYWEAGKELAERDLTGASRNLFTVTDTNSVDTVTSGGQVVSVRYTGARDNFSLDNLNKLPPLLFGISDADVTNPIPDFCTANCDPASTCSDVTSTTCKDCVKECIRDRIVSFMSGNTDIQPVGDPMGSPTDGAQTVGSMGFGCPDLETNTGSFATCSVRLGDIFHSTPVVVGSPSPLFFDVGFQNFAKEFRDRSAAVYVGANDGFLHAFHAGELQTDLPKKNPFTKDDEKVPFFDAGTGIELFGFTPPSFLPDSTSSKDPKSPSKITPPDYRFGDFKTFTAENLVERSFFDGSPFIADVFIDGYPNGIPDDASICTSGAITDPDGTIDPCGKEWHSVLLSGFRNGGGAYTALDVTNAKCNVSSGDQTCSNNDMKKLTNGPDYPRHLWTTFDKNFGNVWPDPTIGRVRMKTEDADGNTILVDRWVMFVGGGLDPIDTNPSNGVDFGNAFYVIDIATGKIIFKFAKDDKTTTPNVTVTDPRMVCDMPSRVGAFDLNADGFIDLVYEGDTCGRLWRFDVSMPIEADDDVTETGSDGTANLTAPDWTGDIAFCANTSAECNKANNVPTSNTQPIFFAPTTVLDDSGSKHVIFVTGNRRDPSNINQFGKLYNFKDGFIPAFLTGGTAVTVSMKTEANFTSGQIINLVPQSGVDNQFTTQGVGTIGNQGEFIVRFPDNVSTPSGEKGFGSPVVINRVLVFTTFAPSAEAEENPCAGNTGVGRIFALDYLSGEPALVRIPGAKNLVQGSSTEANQAAGRTVAEGMPTPAQLTFGARGSVVLTVAFTGSAATGGSQFLVWELPPFPARTQTLFWEEIL